MRNVLYDRREKIIALLNRDGMVKANELVEQYGVSMETIRRDLEKLENDGFAIKSYGGAVINENANVDLPFNIRKKRNVISKQKIAEVISSRIKDGTSIMLDASSTAVYIAKALKERKNLTLITNSIEILIEMFDTPNVNVLSTGGAMREGSFALVGPQTDKMLNSYHVDMAIVSAKGFDLETGLTDTEELHANNKKTMLHAGREKVLAVDSSKFGKTAFTEIGTLEDISMVVTDAKPDEVWLQAFKEYGIECIYPE